MFKSRSRAEWVELLEGTDCCFAPVLSMKLAPDHPQNVARQTFATSGDTTQPMPAPRFGRTPGRLPKPAPVIGADGVGLLRGVGYSASQIEALVGLGALFDGRSGSRD